MTGREKSNITGLVGKTDNFEAARRAAADIGIPIDKLLRDIEAGGAFMGAVWGTNATDGYIWLRTSVVRADGREFHYIARRMQGEQG